MAGPQKISAETRVQNAHKNTSPMNIEEGKKMSSSISDSLPRYILQAKQLPDLINFLQERHFTVVGPTIRDCAVVYDKITSVDQLPHGVADEQQPGFYRVKKRKEAGYFSFGLGPQSFKKFLYPPKHQLWSAKLQKEQMAVVPNEVKETPRYALLGARGCEIKAIEVQDKVFLGGTFIDADYKARRESMVVIAANCTHAGGTCFCSSMDSGPQVRSGFDLAMTEVVHETTHHFVVKAGTPFGEEIVSHLKLGKASENQISEETAIIKAMCEHKGRHLDTTHIKELLYRNDDHPRWQDVGERCLNCGNCTMVCPTCFCMNVEDTIDLTGSNAERTRRWDSCYSLDFSYIHGGAVRSSSSARYRHWITHKLAAWQDQFGMIGCVGCGRCITWCPVGIDITEEAAAIRASHRHE